ncbi:glycosyltransferase [Vibrio parahaemolyticus]|uniref:glycosyltransferase n=1 Tax=Vibrio parahaemolyticus TaxID=670 RepID=UPI0005B69CA3|nr:glycosyltransferase [Vibrio parahaemolyticus]EGQ9589553.1 glycosyltransferase [Vibrio parahaemolyticus]EGR2049733.1 glycosyltransferase [Vibrio parahaemolyticus]EGR2388379.1 glycosyltransferase [Vibrio parahaemolyticus]EGR2597680.1 glycosyltransferase [Vibrio parahaemolyticus]EGR3340649.1 amylovoran biosynthesis protein AmsE [Vibrio parahaemolyticus]
MNSPFSVLCSLYYKEKPDYLEQCFKSLAWQTLKANEVVVVHDGPLTPALYETLEKWQKKLPIKQIIIEKNVGLGDALNKGLEHCSNDLVARVDTDDINHPDRFEKQIKYMDDNPQIAAVSSDIIEFEVTPDKPSKVKKVPSHEKIEKYSLKRNPLNHMATVFRKEAVEQVGSYKHHLYMEDYYLWLRLQSGGFKLSNIPETLVSARVGNGMLERRKGVQYAISELKLMQKIYQLKLTKKPSVAMYFLVRSSSRVLPKRALKNMYNYMRK